MVKINMATDNSYDVDILNEVFSSKSVMCDPMIKLN